MKKIMIAACLGTALNTGVNADQQSDLEVYLGASHYFWDSERNLDNATGFDLGAELPVSEALSFEAWLSAADADIEGGNAELETERYSLGGLYHFADAEESLRPFLSLGAGHLELESSGGQSQDETLAYLGAGVKKYYDNNLMVRAELLGMNSLDNELTDAAVRIAIGYAFGRSASKPVVAEKVMAAQPVTEAKPVVKETAPEPVKKVVPKVPQKDSDGDGVFDSMDQCADTDKAYKVDANGCPMLLSEKVSIKLNVKFPTNSAEITAESLPEIKRVADFMQQFDKTSVTVEGHTDDRGRAAYNKSLSQKRADAVRAALIKEYGVQAKRVKAIGYGEEKPVADNGSAEGRAENRRVVAVVEGEASKPVVK